MNSYKNLPEGYEAVREIDAVGNKRVAVGLNAAALLISALSGTLLYFLRFRRFTFTVDEINFGAYLLFTLGLLLSMFVYLVLHELVHGIVYKLMTREKLTFGISFSCAYCGVPDVFVTKKDRAFGSCRSVCRFHGRFCSADRFCRRLCRALSFVSACASFRGMFGRSLRYDPALVRD